MDQSIIMLYICGNRTTLLREGGKKTHRYLTCERDIRHTVRKEGQKHDYTQLGIIQNPLVPEFIEMLADVRRGKKVQSRLVRLLHNLHAQRTHGVVGTQQGHRERDCHTAQAEQSEFLHRPNRAYWTATWRNWRPRKRLLDCASGTVRVSSFADAWAH